MDEITFSEIAIMLGLLIAWQAARGLGQGARALQQIAGVLGYESTMRDLERQEREELAKNLRGETRA